MTENISSTTVMNRAYELKNHRRAAAESAGALIVRDSFLAVCKDCVYAGRVSCFLSWAK